MQKVIRYAVPLLILAFLLRASVSSLPEIVGYLHGFLIAPFILSCLLLIFVYPEAAFIWQHVLKSLGINKKFVDTLPIWIISNTSRYIPGSVWQYFGRVELTHKRLDVRRKDVAVSLVYEVFLALLAAGFLASFSFLFVRQEFILVPIFAGLGVLLVLNKKISNKIIGTISRVRKINVSRVALVEGNTYIVRAFLLSMLNFVLNGVSLYLLIYSFNGALSVNFALACIAFYSASWAVGFLTFLSPGGLGVFEISLASLLSLFMPFPLASGIALVYRFLLTISELIIFLLVLLYEKRKELLGK